jgi:hypothetical protein
MHADVGMHEVLRQVLQKIGWTFTIPHPSPVQGGWQADITLSSSTTSVTIYGEIFYVPYMARDSAYIYALDYVDRFLGINIIDVNYSVYLPMIHDIPVNDPRF